VEHKIKHNTRQHTAHNTEYLPLGSTQERIPCSCGEPGSLYPVSPYPFALCECECTAAALQAATSYRLRLRQAKG
jgi:hypothetical protein